MSLAKRAAWSRSKTHWTAAVPWLVIRSTNSSQEALKPSNVQSHDEGLTFVTVSLGPCCVRMKGKSSPI